MLEDNNSVVVGFLQKQYGITSGELERIGHSAAFEKVVNSIKEQALLISDLKNKGEELTVENNRLKSEVVSKQSQLEIVQAKLQQGDSNTILKALKSKDLVSQ